MSTQDNNAEEELETVSFRPRPNIITAFSADASPFEALSESVDNAIDHVRSRAYDGYAPEEDLEITISFEAGDSLADSRIIVEDNAGGVSDKNLSRFFQWGASDTAPESIGRFGVGASRIAALGGAIEYQSREVGQPTGYGFEVNVSEMEDYDGEVTDETYQAQRREIDDLEEGHTRIVIKNLTRSLIEILGVEPDSDGDKDSFEQRSEVSDEKWNSAVQGLADQFGDYFERYIANGVQFDADYFPIETPGVDVSIAVELEFPDTSFEATASPPPQIEYSYLPFDSLSPRRYTGLPFDEADDPEEPAVRADIQVGLMLSADDEKAGLTLYANNRKILSRDTANPLFSSDYLGRYRSESGHSRLVIEVELQGEISEMPVNSLKSDLDMNSPISDPLLRIIKNAAKRYRKQTYSSLPQWILNVYDADNPFAGNGGEIQLFDKSGSATNSARFRNQPGNGSGRRMFPERDRLRSIVKVHQALRLRDEAPLLPREKPAYERYFEQEYADNLDDSEFTTAEPVTIQGPELDWAEISITADDAELEVVQQIRQVAKLHSKAGGRADETGELSAWQIPRYREELRRLTEQVDLDDSSLEVWSEIPENLLAQSLVDLANRLERLPQPEEMDEEGPYTSNLYEERFGSWEDAIERAGLRETSDSDNGETSETEDDSEQGTEADSQSGTEDSDTDSSTSMFGDVEDTPSKIERETDSRQQQSSEKQSVEGTGIVVDGDYYQIPEEDQEILNELLGISDDVDPDVAWEELKQILKWYQQMPGK